MDYLESTYSEGLWRRSNKIGVVVDVHEAQKENEDVRMTDLRF